MKVASNTFVVENERTSTGNLSDMAYERIGDMIRNRQLRGSEIIVEARLAEMLGISRTPLREALQKLEGEGLVIKATGRSYMVRRVDLAEYLQSARVREILEAEAAAMAAGRIPAERIAAVRKELDELKYLNKNRTLAHWRSDDNLHTLFSDYCGNDVLASLILNLRVTTRLFEIARLGDRLEMDAAEHRVILEALETEDPKIARKAVQTHIRSLCRFAIDTVR